MKKVIIISILMNVFFYLNAKEISLKRVEPPFWWKNMKNSELQLLIYGENISNTTVTIDNKDIIIQKIHKADNPNYLFIDIDITSINDDGFNLIFKNGNKEIDNYYYALKNRRNNVDKLPGFNSSDVIYLITPDRFANGNDKNDEVRHMADKYDRTDDYGRHGGDIEGIIKHLDYISDMGFTAIWLNPVLENDMKRSSYHGYAITDFYKTDARYGTNEDYLKLSKEARKRGIKLIMDMIPNHCGSSHYWVEDSPFKDWFNFPKSKQRTNHRRTVNQDPYAADIDKNNMNSGWFVEAMPDLNQNNPFMATYLTQNAIWWIEYLSLQGIRIDTYPYPDKIFSAKWTGEILKSYPQFNLVGEEWSYNPVIISYWQKGTKNKDGYESNLPSLMDFPLQDAIYKGLTESEEKWGEGLTKLYEALANDIIYNNPNNFVTFLDNHDMSRFYTQVNENINLLKMGLAYISVIRGIPQIFYGTEILMSNKGSEEHGVIRSDFSGGWKGDKVNGFTGEGLSHKQKDMQNYVKTLLNWRKNQVLIHHGKLLHFAPKDGIYTIFRYNDNHNKAIMLILNKNSKKIELNTSDYNEILKYYTKGKEIFTRKKIKKLSNIKLNPHSATILEIYK